MKNEAHSIEQYSFTADHKFIFDTNIWIYVYGPQGNPADRRTKIYSAALAKILRAQSHLFIDVLILSEFINTYARFHYNNLRPIGWPREYKAFRKGPAFVPISKEIATASRKIVSHCKYMDKGVSAADIDKILTGYEAGNVDFNDLIIVELCRVQGLTLVTHDGDFKDRGLTLLTANAKLLN